MGSLCALLLGAILGALGVTHWWFKALAKPGQLGRYLAASLRTAAALHQRDSLHVRDSEGLYVRLHVNEVARSLEREIEAWQQPLPVAALPPDGFA